MITKNILNNILFKRTYINLAFFSKRKGLEQNIKEKQTKKPEQNNNNNPNTPQYGLVELSKMKFLNIQFFPLGLLLLPTFFSIEQMYDPNFLLGQTLAQKYATFSLLMNLDLKQNKNKTIFILTAMASLQVFTGYYSMITPVGMALLTVLAPFKFTKDQDVYTELQSQRIKNMTNIKFAYFFIFSLLATVKAMHYEAVTKLQKSLDKFNQENSTEIQKKTDLVV